MTRAEFIATAVSSGYCSRKIAQAYADEHPELTADDYIAVYRLGAGRDEPLGWMERLRCYQGAMTTKHLHGDQRDMREEDNR